MGVPNWGILAGILQGVGGFGSQVGGAMQRQTDEALAREKLDNERQYRDAMLQMEQKKLAATENQFAATRADKFMAPDDATALLTYFGYAPPAGSLPPRIRNEDLPALLTRAAEQKKYEREQAALAQQAAILRRAGSEVPGTPAIEPPPEGAMYSEGTPATPGRPADQRLLTAADLLGTGAPIPPLLEKILGLDAENKLVPVTENGLYDPRTKQFIMPPGMGQQGDVPPPPDMPGVRYVASKDVRGRTSWKPEQISVGTDREGLAQERGFRSFADAPDPVKREINQYLDTAALRRQREQGVEAAKLNAKPLTEAEAKDLASATASLAAVKQVKGFSADEIGKYVGLLNRPTAEVQQTLAGLPGGIGGQADKRFIEFKSSVGRMQAAMFDTAGKALTDIERRVMENFIPSMNEPNAEAFMTKVRNFEAFTSAAQNIKLELTRTGRGQIDPAWYRAEFDRRIQQMLGQQGVPQQTAPGWDTTMPAGGGGGWGKARVVR